tara:strand:+ start:326 stop:565 length:240 start_codon:yes stop_codon:yes gene_type:complete
MNKTEIDTKFEIAEILVKHLDCDTSKVLSPLYDYLQKQLILSGVSQRSEPLGCNVKNCYRKGNKHKDGYIYCDRHKPKA